MSDIRYPIGRFDGRVPVNAEDRDHMIDNIARLPDDLHQAVITLNDDQLDTPYRDGGWTVGQVVHHLADSHLNAYVRFKLALTEQRPEIKPYDQDAWARSSDAVQLSPQISLDLLAALHKRWVYLMKSMSDADFQREFNHPESGLWKLNKTLALYDWHGRHHLAHITQLKQRMNWGASR